MNTLKLHSPVFANGLLELPAGQLPLVIGRSKTADITITDDLLSRKHSEVRFENGRFEIRDLESTNLTIVNERDVVCYPLSTGDLILLGDTEIRVEIVSVDPDPNENTTRDLTMLPPDSGS